MPVAHENLPDSELHNPKGFAGAGNSTVAKKNSGGNLEWSTIKTADIADDQVTGDKIAHGTITDTNVDTLTENSITDGTLGGNKLQIQSGNETKELSGGSPVKTWTVPGTILSWWVDTSDYTKLIIGDLPGGVGTTNAEFTAVQTGANTVRIRYYGIGFGDVQLNYVYLAD